MSKFFVSEQRKKENMSHFISRLEERYGIIINESQYWDICSSFQGKFKRGSGVIGKSVFNGESLWCFYSTRTKRLATVYPKSVDKDVYSMMHACFPRPLRYLASIVYDDILEEIEAERRDFAGDTEAAKYYFTHCKYSILLLHNFQNKPLSPILVCCEISKVLKMQHKGARLQLVNLKGGMR